MKIRGFEKISIEQWIKDIKDEFYLDSVIATEMYKNISLPKRATAHSAGYDFFSPIEFELEPNKDIKIPLGIKSYMQEGEVLLIHPRSSLGFKYYCKIANEIPVIDGDYYDNEKNEGHIWLKIRNEGDITMKINEGDAICQGIFMPYLLSDGDSFEGNKRVGGMGSTTTTK